MRKSPLFLLFSFALLLAACGGGGGGGGGTVLPGGGGSTSTPASTPTPAPTPTATATPIPGAGQPLAGPSADPAGDWGPPAVANVLDFPVQHSYDGTGQTIAIVIDSDVSRTDLSKFFSYFSIPTTGRTITTVSVDGASGTVSGSQGEATLDTEWTAALAPGANIMIYQVPTITSDQDLTDAYNKIITDKKAFIVNNSFGGCEFSPVPEDPVIATAAADGITFTASSGDNGNLCQTSPNQAGASWPASNPHVVAVGGTETWNGAPLNSQQVWNDTWCTNCGGGGGVSGMYSAPAYQTSPASILAGCQSPPSGSPCSTTMRNEPDISYPAVDAGIIESGKWVPLAGTSWSSPEAAALYAELYQYCGANGAAIPGVNEPASFAYYVYTQASADFIDVNSGNNQMAGLAPWYSAFAGYDVASGLGVPKGWAFVQTACPGHVPPATLRSTMSVASAAAFPAHTAAYTLDVTPRVPGMSDLGVRPANTPTRIQLVMNPAGDVAASEEAAIRALQNAGFTITQTFSNHLVVDAVAPSSTVGKFFRTSMHDVWQGQYGTHYLPTTQIVVPASIAPYVARVSLDDVAKYHHRSHFMDDGPLPQLP